MIPPEYFDVLSVLRVATSYVTCVEEYSVNSREYSGLLHRMQDTLHSRKWQLWKVLHTFTSNACAHLSFMLSCSMGVILQLQCHTCSRAK